MIRIAIDARALEEAEGTGVARYLRNILREWDRRPFSEAEVWCYTRRPVEDMTRFRRLHWRIVPGGALGRRGLVWQNAVFPAAAERDGASLLWAPFNLAPLATRLPVAVTIHDVSYAANPAWFGARERYLWQPLARRSARRAAVILTDSRFSQSEIVARLGVPSRSIVVTPLAADPSLHPAGAAAIAATRRRLGLTGPYVLYLGALFARRNIGALLNGFVRAAATRPDWSLILVGPNRHHPPLDLAAELRLRALDAKVKHLQYVDEDDLAPLLSGAAVFVYPSSYEGFGLPVLEAMACGAPVITGAATSLPEVAGAAAILLDPTSSRAIGSALTLLGTQDALRVELIRRGFAQAARFSWERTAALTLDALRAAATSSPSPARWERRLGCEGTDP